MHYQERAFFLLKTLINQVADFEMLGNRILIVAAHPDDDILGCGGIMARCRKEGAAVKVVFLGEGSTSRFDASEREGQEALAAIEERQKSAKMALEILGVEDWAFYDLSDGLFDMTSVLDIGKIIESEIANFSPDTVFTHSHVDANNDHGITFQATLQATRPGALNHVENVLSYEVPTSTEWRFTEAFTPNYLVGIEDEMEAKVKAMAAYTSEQKPYPFPRSAEGLRTLAKVRGMQAGLPYAEAFQVIRAIRP